jgi:16S rRNA (cytidine1402-2'-O)-methyltransferase
VLYLVPTPIGNLQDMTFRAVEVLRNADLILAEDTRTSFKLMQHFGIKAPITPFHQHNEHFVLPHMIGQLEEGKKMCLITDAGTPGISDPGFLLVRECIRHNIQVECLPGATAFVPALVNSGIPTNRFCFEGFLPIKKGRQTMLTKLSTEERTIILYESPLRLVRTLGELIQYFGEYRKCSVSRELTKMFEENKRGTLKDVHEYFSSKHVKGEIVIVIEGYKETAIP